MQRLLTTFVLTLLAISLQAVQQQDGTKRVRYKDGPAYIYRVSLTDKANTLYSFDHPTRFLSRRAIERRKRQGLAIDSTDLPVSSHYIRLIKKNGIDIVGQSRWQNTVLVRMKDSTLISGIRQLPCVKACKLVWLSPDSITPDKRISFQSQFEAYDSIPNILGWHDFVKPNDPQLFSETDHGTKVLSIMGTYHPYLFIGTAPKASYWLLRSEDQETEQEVEEDYWTMAAEFYYGGW